MWKHPVGKNSQRLHILKQKDKFIATFFIVLVFSFGWTQLLVVVGRFPLKVGDGGKYDYVELISNVPALSYSNS